MPATMEGCIVRLIDKVAYCGKDIEDAREVQLIDNQDIPGLIRKELGNNNGQIVGVFIEDMIATSYAKDYIAISKDRCSLLHQMIAFNREYIYDSDKAKKYAHHARLTLKLLFEKLLEILQHEIRFSDETQKDELEVVKIFRLFVKDMKDMYDASTPDELIVLDFVAGMTDGFVLRSFEELFLPKPTV